MTSTVITPTVGRKVWFRQNGIKALQEAGVLEYLPTPLIVNGGDQPLDATVVYVWNDRCVNLTILDHSGHPFIATSVPLLQDGDEKPASGFYCEWMPYQKGQAAKAEAAQASEPSGYPTTTQRAQLEYALVSGAAARLAEDPRAAADIAKGIQEVLNALHPTNAQTGVTAIPVVDPGPDSLEREIQAKASGTVAPHQQRVLDEKRELDERLSKLDAFILDNPLYLQLPTDEQDRLSRQSRAMAAYSGILDERIASF